MGIYDSLDTADPLSKIRPKSTIKKIFDYEFLNPNLWEFTFDDNTDIQYLVQSVSLPFIKFETETRNIGSKVLKSVSPEESFSITFYETSDLRVYEYMSKWMDSIYDKKQRKFNVATVAATPDTFSSTNPYSTPQKGYVKTGMLSLYKYNKANIFTAATTEPTKSWVFTNLMITGIDQQDWNYEESSGKQITCQFTVDSVDEL